MKRFCLLLCVCIFAMFLTGCEKKDDMQSNAVTSIYATFYPLYAAAEWLVSGASDVQLNCLVQPQDGCLRAYQLSDWDLALLNSADLIIAGGCGLESFESVLYALGENGPAVSALLYNMDLRKQKGINTQIDSQSHWLDLNPHIYMTTDGMKEIARRIANSLTLFDPGNDSIYQKNLEDINHRLDMLHDEISEDLAHLKNKKVIVMNEALVYAVEEYGLDADLFYDRESGAGLYDADLKACLDTLKKSDAKVILIEKQAPQAFCEALEEAGYSLACIDILSSTRPANSSDGYFEAQKANVCAIIDAFAGISIDSGV